MKDSQNLIAKMTSLWLRIMKKLSMMQLKPGIAIIGEKLSTQNQDWKRLVSTTTDLLVSWFSWLQRIIADCIILASISQKSTSGSWVSRWRVRTIQDLESITQQKLERKLAKRVRANNLVWMASISQKRRVRRWAKHTKARWIQPLAHVGTTMVSYVLEQKPVQKDLLKEG